MSILCLWEITKYLKHIKKIKFIKKIYSKKLCFRIQELVLHRALQYPQSRDQSRTLWYMIYAASCQSVDERGAL